ncbi:MAG TPA: DUF2092 domain-containing protein [Solirubrobacteraceae bacterium]|nr:DUF2092 domain-containing protein [Solirubrobacteraceae bacterium]
MNFLRRISLNRLLLLCGATVAIGISATALALALGGGPTPPAKPLAQAVHDALAGGHSNPIQGYSANVKLTDRLIEGSELAGGGSGQPGGLASSPLLTGASGRLWVSSDGKMRLELQAEKGDTQIVYDGHTVTVYDASSNTIYKFTPKERTNEAGWKSYAPHDGKNAEPVPSVAKIEEALAEARKHAKVSEGTATDVAGRPAYTVRVSPNEGGSLIGGAELSFDADNGLPLRTAVYSSTGSSPVIELAASEVSYGPVDPSVFQITPPADAKVEDLTIGHGSESAGGAANGNGKTDANKPKLTTHGKGISSIAVLEAKSSAGGSSSSSSLESLPKVKIGGATASELRTELGTILTFERGGLRYVLAGAVAPAAVEALAKGL